MVCLERHGAVCEICCSNQGAQALEVKAMICLHACMHVTNNLPLLKLCDSGFGVRADMVGQDNQAQHFQLLSMCLNVLLGHD